MQSLRNADRAGGSAASFRRNLLGFVRLCVCLVLIACIAAIGTVLWELRKVPSLAFLDHYQPVSHIQIYDKDDKLVCNIEGTEKRIMIPLSRVHPYLQRAVLTAEDHHFYDHHGIDLLGILRACLVNATAGHPLQGGSTITQQLAKNLFFEDQKRTIQVKLAEALVAWQLEVRFAKEKILELYLNEVYFGNGAFGIEQAAQAYFNKHADQLGIGESAFLAGLIRSPSRAGQIEYRQTYLARQREVIEKMREYGFLDQHQADLAQNEILVFKAAPIQAKVKCKVPKYPYYISYVLEQVHQNFSEGEIQRHGLKVYTNLDVSAQEAAERALAEGIRRAPAGVNQGALVSINVTDGAVVALVGGVGDFMKNQWNCATNPHTVGSAFKPFVYLAAFESGMLNPNSIVDDSPLTVLQSDGKEYKPKNFDGKYMGDITAAEALAFSRNVCAVRVAQSIGVESVILTARRAGIRQPIEPHLSVALGFPAISPLEMAGAYSTFARGGVVIQPCLIRRIDNKSGYTLRAYGAEPERTFDMQPIAQLVDVLQQVVVQGTAQQAQLGDRPVAGKTGTADQAKDLWFIGFTPDLVTAVWSGNSDNKPIMGSHITGGTVMARIWRDYNRAYYARHPMPSGWFIACTKLVGQFQQHAEKKADRAAPRRAYAHAVNTHKSNRPAATPQVVHTRNGVTDYRWSR